MKSKNFLVIVFSVLLLANVSAALSLDSDSLSDALEEGSDNLEENVEESIDNPDEVLENSTDELKDEVLEEEEVTGILIPTDDSFSSRLDNIRSNIPQQVPAKSYILLSDQNTFLVFSDKSLSVGEYRVKGNRLSSFELSDMEYATIISDNINEQDEKNVDLEELEENTGNYQYQEVELSGTLRQASVSTDSQTHIASSLSFGVITTMSPLDKNLAANMRERTEKLAKDPSFETGKDVLGFSESSLPVIDLNQRYWSNTEAEVTGVVLAPEDVLRVKDLAAPETKNLIEDIENRGALYVKEVDYDPSRTDFEEIHDLEPGENVQFEGEGIVKAVSMQEVLSASGVPVPVDTVLKTGLMTDVDNPEETVIVVGATSRKGQFTGTSGGRYSIKGKTVSAQSVDSSFPEGRNMIVLHNLDRKYEIDDFMEEKPDLSNKEDIIEDLLNGNQVNYDKEKTNSDIEETEGQKIIENQKEVDDKDNQDSVGSKDYRDNVQQNDVQESDKIEEEKSSESSELDKSDSTTEKDSSKNEDKNSESKGVLLGLVNTVNSIFGFN